MATQIVDFGSEFLEGYRIGQTLKQQREQQQRDEEERKLRMDALKLQLNAEKFGQKVNMWKVQRESAADQYRFQDGQPAQRAGAFDYGLFTPEVQVPETMATPQIEPGVPTTIADMLMRIRQKPVMPVAAPIRERSEGVPLLPESIQFPAFNDPESGLNISGFSARPRSAEQISEAATRQKAIDAQIEAQKQAAIEASKMSEMMRDVRILYPDFDRLDNAGKLKAFGEYMNAKGQKIPGRDVPLSPEVEAQRSRISRSGSSVSDNGKLVTAVMNNPNLYDDLTPSVKTEIAAELAKAGFSGFGKQLSESAITKMSDARSAVASLRDLRDVLQKNEQYIGPLAGIQALNPYSEGRKAQADIDRVKQRVGKALEGGVLRKEDEDKYKKILATLSDVPETAIYKIDGIIQELERDLSIFIEEQQKAGRRVSVPPKSIRMRAPNGEISNVSADEVEHYKSLGAVEVK